MSRLSKIDADMFSTRGGEYLMKIRMGTPPVEVFGYVDTCSDFLWVQCKPTKKSCYNKTAPPVFLPASSSTYQRQPCRSKACDTLQDFKLPCNAQNICLYDTQASNCSNGELAMDTFWLGSTPINHTMFMCGSNVGSLGDRVISADIGIGGDSLSLISQLEPVIQGKFSYCLMPQTNDAMNKTIKMHFGDRANVSGPNVVSTPMIKKFPPSFHYVDLIDVLAGNKTSRPVFNRSRRLDHIEYGNMIIDITSTITTIPEEMYDRFTRNIAEDIGGEGVQDPTGLYNRLCYKDLNVTRVPVVTFRFDYADIKVHPSNLFLEVGQGVSCLSMLYADDELGVFGNLYQRDLLVGFDLVKQKVSFKPTDCSLYN
ncbi:aspartic proteinase CDR1-like [Bidens hawaiensis]|uniref:aspartic proteinase CDR1-like n=1 Tax=Bidens hawaiensis TaxID=980011 RepID=UPI00404A0299